MNFTVTLRNFNKAGAGPAGNPDYGFLPEPANAIDKKIVKVTLSAAKKPVYNPATGFNTTTTHSEWCRLFSLPDKALLASGNCAVRTSVVTTEKAVLASGPCPGRASGA